MGERERIPANSVVSRTVIAHTLWIYPVQYTEAVHRSHFTNICPYPRQNDRRMDYQSMDYPGKGYLDKGYLGRGYPRKDCPSMDCLSMDCLCSGCPYSDCPCSDCQDLDCWAERIGQTLLPNIGYGIPTTTLVLGTNLEKDGRRKQSQVAYQNVIPKVG
jgi:hypothetical protein